MRLCEWTQFSSYTVSHTPRSRQCCHDMFHTRWQRRHRTGNQAINWTSRMAYNLTNLFYNAPLQTSKMSISDQRKMLRCMVDRLIRCHTLSMHSNRHGKKNNSKKFVWIKTCSVQPFWCVTFWHAKFAIHRRDASDTETWPEHSWKEMRASHVCLRLNCLCTMFHTTLDSGSDILTCFTQNVREDVRIGSCPWTVQCCMAHNITCLFWYALSSTMHTWSTYKAWHSEVWLPTLRRCQCPP